MNPRGRKTNQRRITAVEKAGESLRLRAEGYTYRAIAHQLGYKDPSGAQRAVERALQATMQEASDHLRVLELERLDNLHNAIWGRAMNGEGPAIDRVLRVMERRSKLLGLDAPARQEITGKDGSPVQVQATIMDLTRLSDDELTILEEILERAESSGSASEKRFFVNWRGNRGHR
ncbi:MAG: hypothetical protein HYZ13_10430 [Acidobacteria bacterium]|nr:hypothetical protein [Acidobacteriota bacterium]